jgi:hypothetical protein
MFAIVLKNVILVFLIIAIIYFLLKSRLLEVNQYKALEKKKEEAKINKGVRKVPDTISYPHPERSRTGDENMKELYNFVYDDPDAETNLKQFYNEDVVVHKCVDNADKAISCADQSRQKADSLCASTITKHYELLDKKQVKNGGIVNMPQSCINEALASYEAENIMNGAEIMNGLTGFDTFSADFATL